MPNPLYNMYNNMINHAAPSGANIIQQLMMIKNGQTSILDILAQQGKINQQQYNQLQPYKNNPQQIFNILYNSGYASQLNVAEGQAKQTYGNFQQDSFSQGNGNSAVN